MSTWDVHALDADHPAQVEAWIDLWRDATVHDRPDDQPPSRHQVLTNLRAPAPGSEIERWVSMVDGRTVGMLRIGFNTIDNLDNVQVGGTVHPGFRRRGIGRALWAKALDRISARGCARVDAMAIASIDGGPHRDTAGVEFLSAMGLSAKLTEIRRRVDLSTVDQSAADDLLAEAWTHADGYALRVWISHVPPDLLDGCARLNSRLLEDAPTGELDIEAQRIDGQRLRDLSAVAAKGLRTSANVGIQHEATGEVVAWSCLGHGLEHDGYAEHQITIVDRDHRGHRLGTVAKLELHRYALAVTPTLRFVDTVNAAENAHMIAINDLLGFRPIDSHVVFQGAIPEKGAPS